MTDLGRLREIREAIGELSGLEALRAADTVPGGEGTWGAEEDDRLTELLEKFATDYFPWMLEGLEYLERAEQWNRKSREDRKSVV